MNDSVRATLKKLITQHGTDLCSNRQRLEGMLREDSITLYTSVPTKSGRPRDFFDCRDGTERMRQQEPVSAVQKAYDFMLWMLLQVAKILSCPFRAQRGMGVLVPGALPLATL